jgi:hypothetical protein
LLFDTLQSEHQNKTDNLAENLMTRISTDMKHCTAEKEFPFYETLNVYDEKSNTIGFELHIVDLPDNI